MDLLLQVCSFSKLISTHTADGAMIKVCAGQTVACLPTHHHPVDLAILQWEILGNMSKLSHLFPALTRNNHDTMQQGPKVDLAVTQQTLVNCQSEMKALSAQMTELPDMFQNNIPVANSHANGKMATPTVADNDKSTQLTPTPNQPTVDPTRTTLKPHPSIHHPANNTTTTSHMVLSLPQMPILVWQQLELTTQAANHLCVDNLLEKTQQLMDELGQLIPALTAFTCNMHLALFLHVHPVQNHLPVQFQNSIIWALDDTTTLLPHAQLANLAAIPSYILLHAVTTPTQVP